LKPVKGLPLQNKTNAFWLAQTKAAKNSWQKFDANKPANRKKHIHCFSGEEMGRLKWETNNRGS
jgi:hypothetical protein